MSHNPSEHKGPTSTGRDPCKIAAGSMSCKACTDFLLDYVDGLLPQDQLFTFESHVAFCPDCETFLDNYKKASALMAGLGRTERAKLSDEIPASLIEAILKSRKGT
jgi:anti-sigma factor RsiW